MDEIIYAVDIEAKRNRKLAELSLYSKDPDRIKTAGDQLKQARLLEKAVSILTDYQQILADLPSEQ